MKHILILLISLITISNIHSQIMGVYTGETITDVKKRMSGIYEMSQGLYVKEDVISGPVVLDLFIIQENGTINTILLSNTQRQNYILGGVAYEAMKNMVATYNKDNDRNINIQMHLNPTYKGYYNTHEEAAVAINTGIVSYTAIDEYMNTIFECRYDAGQGRIIVQGATIDNR